MYTIYIGGKVFKFFNKGLYTQLQAEEEANTRPQVVEV